MTNKNHTRKMFYREVKRKNCEVRKESRQGFQTCVIYADYYV